MNTYHKFTANVFVAKCEERQEKGEIITLTTKYGKENDCIVFNLVGKDKDGNFYYSIVRSDGFNFQEYCKKKAEKLQAASQNAENKSTEFWKASHEGRDFLAMGEPIKVGHHSEKRHRALIDRNHNRMSKSVEQTKIAENYESRADYWERKAKDINLSMPESIEYYEYKHEEAKERHEGLKSGKYERSHSYSLTYAKKAVNEAEKNFKTAQKLWE
jgi:hypothetical protein